MELMSIRMFMEIMLNTLIPDENSPYSGLSPEKKLDAFTKAFDGYKEYLDSNCKPVKMLIEKKLEEVDRENVTEEFIRELIDDAYPVCAIFAMG